MSLLKRLKQQFEGETIDGFPEIKKQGDSQYYIKFENHSFMTSKNIPSEEYLRKELRVMLKKGCNPLEIQAYLVEKWGSTKKRGTRFNQYTANGKYVGSMEYVKFKTNNTQNVKKSKAVCFIPWYGDIHLTPYDNTIYDPNKLNNTIKDLFFKTKVLYVPKLDDRKYKHFINHFFVQFVTLESFEKIVKENDLKFDIKLTKKYSQTTYLREELNESLRENTKLNIEISKLKEENKELQYEINAAKELNKELAADLDDIVSSEIETITKEKKIRKEPVVVHTKKKGYHYLGKGHGDKVGRTPGFYRATRKNGRWVYSGNGYKCDDPTLFLHIFNLDTQGYAPKEILKRTPLFKGTSNRYAPLRNILLSYRNGEFEHAIRFIVRNYDVDNSYLNLVKFKPVSVLDG